MTIIKCSVYYVYICLLLASIKGETGDHVTYSLPISAALFPLCGNMTDVFCAIVVVDVILVAGVTGLTVIFSVSKRYIDIYYLHDCKMSCDNLVCVFLLLVVLLPLLYLYLYY